MACKSQPMESSWAQCEKTQPIYSSAAMPIRHRGSGLVQAVIKHGASDALVTCIFWSLRYITVLISLQQHCVEPHQAAGLWDIQLPCGSGMGCVWKSADKDPLKHWVQGQNLRSNGSIRERVRCSCSSVNSLPGYNESKFSDQILSDSHFLVNGNKSTSPVISVKG